VCETEFSDKKRQPSCSEDSSIFDREISPFFTSLVFLTIFPVCREVRELERFFSFLFSSPLLCESEIRVHWAFGSK